jgi:archaellum component FlaC
MPDRKEPRLVLPDDPKPAKPEKPAETRKPAASGQSEQAKAAPLNREASEAARAEVRRRLAEKNAAREAEKAKAQATPPPRPAPEPGYSGHAEPGFGGSGGGGGGYYPTVQGEDPGKGFPWLAAFALLLAVGGLAFGGWQYQRAENQQSSLESVANRVQELEIRLSETGQDLTEAGSTFSEKLEWADSEIRKLWVVAHQRNRPAIEELETSLKDLQNQVAGVSRTANEANQKSDRLSSQLSQQTSELKQQLAKLSREVESYSSRLAEVSLTTSTLSQQLRDQDRREQVTALRKDLQGLTTRVTDLAGKQTAEVPENLDKRLAEYDEILASLEASRSQLTSRVTRLMDDVRELQQSR